MKLLLDTNAFLRWKVGRHFPRSVQRVLIKADTECLVSIVTGWEIVLKAKLGLNARDIENGIRDMRASVLPIRFQHLNALAQLPLYQDHRDPFDRMLIAQALSEGIPIVTSDTRFAGYRQLRVLWD